MENKQKLVEDILSRGVVEVIDRENLKSELLSGGKLRIKLGIDPTSPDIHLGRAVAILKLRDFQMLGHQIVFIVGDFTGQIGDTSDKESERSMLTQEAVKFNMHTYLDQAGKILDMDKVEVKFNAGWLDEIKLRQFCLYADAFSVAEFIARENIRKRLDSGKRVSLREMLYPLMQAYDSVEVKADVEIGGTDQKFNLLAGRTLQKALGEKPQHVLMSKLIFGTDGRKMSSSWGNTINICDRPNDMFGKVMGIPDEFINDYFIHCTRMPMDEVEIISKAENPRDAKLKLAQEIVRLYHGREAAAKATEYFVNTFSKKQLPEVLSEHTPVERENIASFIVRIGLAGSKSDARRKIGQGGVEIDGKKITDWQYEVGEKENGKVMKVGKKDFVKIVFK